MMDSPVHLAIDKSCASDIEEGSDGIWRIVGGKRILKLQRNFFQILNVLKCEIQIPRVCQVLEKQFQILSHLVTAWQAHERALLLKKFAASASDEEVLELANQVSLYTGCSHHWNQIAVAKKLIEEGTKLWSLLSQNDSHVPWESAIYEIEEYFMKIASCNTRTLSQK
ncbi:SH2 domain-containing protein B-like [Eucalyptus grandis]|uniref:SH2 domain-containing protein B-like n=1 Tax=Eucalyptus grandis TaxID=71139 RepID=UPI00192EE415|nr:SH2 domain-containing protein B-like [Eucalyptus grandis]